jgi:hypothetical protein
MAIIQKPSLGMYFSCNQLVAVATFGSVFLWIDSNQFGGFYISQTMPKESTNVPQIVLNQSCP